MSHTDMEATERQQDAEQAGCQADMLQALRSAALPDDFWMYSYKILPCPHGYRHSWTHCPFSHVGETACRRCPRAHSYIPEPCGHARAKRQCPNGDACPYAHNTFEQWLHPARYRTRLCYLGANCRRPTCFFAHSVDELRSVEENEAAPSTAATSALLPPLPVPPPLPSPAQSTMMPSSGLSGDFGNLAPAMSMVGGGGGGGAPNLPAVPAGAPMSLLQPVVLMGIPQPLPQQPHGAMRPEMMAAHGAVQCYVPYQPRPTMLRPPLPLSAPPPPPPPPALQADSGAAQQMRMHMQMHPPAVHVAVRRQAPAVRPQNLANPAMTMAAVHHPGSFVYLHSNVPPPMPAGAQLQGPPPPPPPPPQAYASPFITPGGYHCGGEGVPPSVGPAPMMGRMRSWSNPGETTYVVSAAPAVSGGGGALRTYVGGGGELPMWTSVDAGRRAAVLPSAVAATAPSPRSVAPPAHGGGGRGGGGATAAPRHMPAPTNRSGAVRRMSTPAGVSYQSPPAAAFRPDPSGSAVSSPGLAGAAVEQQRMSADGMEAEMRNLALTKPFAAPPPTPAVSRFGGACESPYSPSQISSPPSGVRNTIGSPSAALALAYDPAAAAAARADLSTLRSRPSANGVTPGSGAFSRPSSSGSGSSAGAMLNAYDTSSTVAAAAAAAALAAVTARVESPTDAVAAAAMLQQVLRSTSASAAEPPSGLLPALLAGGGAISAVHADLYYDDDVEVMERSSDPGPGGLHAAIRRISNEFGSAAACGRNSDPGQSVPTSSPDVQQLLLPLLQSVLTEGLATGQFEVVDGQLQVKNGSGAAAASATADGGVSRGVGSPGAAVGPCVSSPGVNA
ncbi:hypothetical protein PLESTB_001592700 [Pleodorina starrii]|uniref:C3H1-type domain-containing protein n=1 Tax=Pleodorina starrii TaxID=330485 RepID=A0A9W6F8H2_9CHLO|nr:hypothetical protein PLESTB_001592700 [Pleodorina starrii]